MHNFNQYMATLVESVEYECQCESVSGEVNNTIERDCFAVDVNVVRQGFELSYWFSG